MKNKLHKIHLLSILLMGACLIASAQEDVEVPIYNDEVKITPSFAFNQDFNLDDWYVGLSGGVEDIGYQWGARVGFQFRPFKKKIQVLEDNNVIRQYIERKYFIFVDADKRLGHLLLFDSHFQFYFGGRGGLLMGNYTGTRNDAKNHWVIAPVGGFCFNYEDEIFIKIGYMHFRDHLFSVDDGRINFSMIFNLRP